jgi:hypothetical protein
MLLQLSRSLVSSVYREWVFLTRNIIQSATHHTTLQEKPILFRRYLTLHGLITAAAFSVAAAWTILSGTRHSQAQTKCEQDFFDGESGSIATEGETLCNIFSWIDLGIMGALWLILAIMQVRLIYKSSLIHLIVQRSTVLHVFCSFQLQQGSGRGS